MEENIIKIWLSKADMECLNEGEEITIDNKIDIEVDRALKNGKIDDIEGVLS